MQSIRDGLTQAPQGPVHLVPFIPAGYGGLDATRAALPALAKAGASVIEVGIPFSDPIADGPTIQAAYHDALQGGVTLEGCLEAIGETTVDCPMLAMVSYSVVRRRGDAAFCERAKAAGLSGLLIPDLPPPEAERFCEIVKAAGLDPVLLVAPTTPPARRDVIGRLAGGFVYYLSVAGITGQRDALPPDLASGVEDMKGRTELPVCVGFGIGKAEHLRQLRGVADGAIVGSAFVRAMGEAMRYGPVAIAAACGTLARELLGQA